MSSNKRLFWLSFVVAAIAVLFGWSAAENAGDLRTCELSVGAINSADAKVDIRRVTTSAFSRAIRIDYNLTLPNRSQSFNRFVVCHFAVEQTPPFRSGLSALATETGPIPEANLFMLRRFYLDTGEVNSARFPSGKATGVQGVIAHMAEWLLSVAAQASLLALLAFIFLSVFKLLRNLPPNMFYGMSAALAAGCGALAMTGTISRIAPALAITTGIVNGGMALVLQGESDKDRAHTKAPQYFPWLLFGGFVAMALFWFPAQGMFGPHWLPPFLFTPLKLFNMGGSSLSSTPLALGLIGLAALVTIFLSAASRKERDGALPGFVVFLGLMGLSGIVSACGYLQYGLGFNPLLLATKALLITLAALAAPIGSRGVQLLLSSLALVSLEYALAPFLAKPVVDLASYGLLFLLLVFTRASRRVVP